MSILLIAEVNIKPDKVEELQNYMAEILPDTRSFEGCNSIEIYMNSEDNTKMVLVENWESIDNYHKYHEWRVEMGAIDIIRSMIDGRPSRMVLDKLDI